MEEEAHRRAHAPLLPRASSLHSASSRSRFGPCLASECEHLGIMGRVSSEGERESERERRRAGGRAGVRTSREGQSARRSLACPPKSLALPLVLACARLENELAERGDTSCSPSALKRFRLLASSGRRGAVEPRAALAAQLTASRLKASPCFCASPSCSTSGRERGPARGKREEPEGSERTEVDQVADVVLQALALALARPLGADERTHNREGGRPTCIARCTTQTPPSEPCRYTNTRRSSSLHHGTAQPRRRARADA